MKPGLALVAVVGAGLVAGGLIGACQTVDLGSPPADIDACHPSEIFFVQRVWPDVLSASYGGKHCADSQCHGVGNQTPLTFIATPQPPMQAATMAMPSPAVTLPLPDDWAANYLAASQEMNCDDPTASKLITTPTSPTHGGGVLFATTAMEVVELTAWVTASP